MKCNKERRKNTCATAFSAAVTAAGLSSFSFSLAAVATTAAMAVTMAATTTAAAAAKR